MSSTALCSAVVERIKTVLSSRSERWIDVRPDGEPTSAITGDVFVAVWHAGFKGGPRQHNFIDEIHSIGVTISLKTHKDHIDYWGLRTNLPWDGSLDYAVRKIIGAIHCQPAVIVAANARLETGISSPFVEMLLLRDAKPKERRGAKWWGTETTAKSTRTNDTVGWSQDIIFTGARRIQSMDSYQ